MLFRKHHAVGVKTKIMKKTRLNEFTTRRIGNQTEKKSA